MAPYIREKRYVAGMILVIIGMLLIIENLRFVPDFIPYWIWSWQFLLIGIGIFSLLTSENTGPGLTLIAIGTIFLLSDILPEMWPWVFDLFTNPSSLFWYLLIIIIGISLIIRGMRRAPQDIADDDRSSHRKKWNTKRSVESDQDYIDELTIFGGTEKIITTDNFKGGKVTTMLGGTDINLLQSELAAGVNVVDVFSMFGGFTLIVPPHWQVKIDVMALFGGVSDKRIIPPDTVRDNTRQLVIRGFVIFGGGDIKSR